MILILLACLWTASAIAEEADRKIDGKRYRIVTVEPENAGTATIATIELREAGPGIAAINADLRRMLADARNWAAECNRDSLDSMLKEPGDFYQATEPTWWTDRLLAVSIMTNSTCGGPHPNVDPDYVLWDTATGKRIVVNRWFTANALKKSGERDVQLSAPLKAIVLKHAERARDDDCGEVLRDSDYYLIQPGPAGMVFVPSLPHVVQACADDVVVPYALLDAFLKGAARQVIAGSATPRAAPAR